MTAAPATYDDLTAVYINCSLKPDPADSHTQLLVERSIGVMQQAGVTVDRVHAAAEDIPHGVYEDMTEHGAPGDGWPAIQARVMAADILVLATPIWLGDKSSVCAKVIERLYGYSGELNDAGQSAYYGRTAGCLVTGNEDGVKHVAMNVLYSLQHLGYTIPPQADAGWLGEIGPGPSYGDRVDGRDAPVGFDSDFTNRNTTFMTWNLIHVARLLKDAGGIPAHGNLRPAWSDGERFGYPVDPPIPNPEYR